jgi:Leucine-rich repeat (LRR) protein
MQWCVKVPFSSSSFSLFPNNNFLSSILITMTFIFNIINLPSSVHTLSISACSPYFFIINIDIRTNNQYIQPCPISTPCQCICEIESKRLWIDCFYRQLKSFPIFKKIQTNNTIIEWNIDLAFNLFENLTFNNQTEWIADNMHIRHMVLSSSLAYDLIVQLNLTHRHLIDIWPSQQHLPITDDQFILSDDYENDKSEEDLNDLDKIKRSIILSNAEYTRLLTDLTIELRQQSKRINIFTLSLSGEPSPISNLYLDHNSLNSIPIKALYNATGLYEIYLSFNNIIKLPEYSFGFSHRLTRVDLSHNKLISINNLTFQRHPDAFAGPFLIDYLDLSHNQLTILEPNIFSYLVNLRLLKLEHNQIYSISAHIWTGLYRLKYLDLSHNYIDNITQSFYSGYLNELNHLKITSNNLSQIGPCEFLSLKSLIKLNLSGNNITIIDTCSFYGLRRITTHSSLHVHLRSNQLETIHPCTFINFARSTIHLENNPLICNCSFNYLLHIRQSIAYTGKECLGGFSYQSQNQQLTLPAVRKMNSTLIKKPINASIPCQDSYKYYNDLCTKLDCTSQCAPNERFIIQVTTISTPSGTKYFYQQTFLSIITVVLVQYSLV